MTTRMSGRRVMVGRIKLGWVGVAACALLLGCAGPNGELPRLSTAAQQASPGSGYGVQGGYIGTSGAFTSLGNH